MRLMRDVSTSGVCQAALYDTSRKLSAISDASCQVAAQSVSRMYSRTPVKRCTKSHCPNELRYVCRFVTLGSVGLSFKPSVSSQVHRPHEKTLPGDQSREVARRLELQQRSRSLGKPWSCWSLRSAAGYMYIGETLKAVTLRQPCMTNHTDMSWSRRDR